MNLRRSQRLNQLQPHAFAGTKWDVAPMMIAVVDSKALKRTLIAPVKKIQSTAISQTRNASEVILNMAA
jgi:hypothetical protein